MEPTRESYNSYKKDSSYEMDNKIYESDNKIKNDSDYELDNKVKAQGSETFKLLAEVYHKLSPAQQEKFDKKVLKFVGKVVAELNDNKIKEEPILEDYLKNTSEIKAQFEKRHDKE